MGDDTNVWKLAEMLHETGRRAVEARKIYRSDLPVKPFAEWKDLDEDTKQGRFMMAEDLIRLLPGIVTLLD